MSKEENHIDDFFIEGLAEQEIIPPADVWTNIEKELNRKRRAGVITLWSGLAAGLAMLMGLGGYYFYSNQTNPEIVAEMKADKQENKSVINDETKANFTAQTNRKQGKDQSEDFSAKQQYDRNSSINKQNQSNEINSPLIAKNDKQVKSDLISGVIDESTDEIKGTESSKDQPLNTIASDPEMRFINPRYRLLPEVKTPVAIVAVYEAPVPFNSDYLLAISDITDNSEEKNVKRWSVEGQIAPQYSYRNISDIAEPMKAQFNAQEKGIVAYAAGIKVNYEVKRRLSVQVGVMYSVMGQSQDNAYAFSATFSNNNVIQDFNSGKVQNYWANNSLGAVTKQSVAQESTVGSSLNSKNYASDAMFALSSMSNQTDVKFVQQLKFVEVPVLARYKIIDRKIGLHVLGGVSTNLLVNSNFWFETPDAKSEGGEIENLRTVNYGTSLGFGINYKLWEKATISVEPMYKYYLNSIKIQSDNKYHPYSFGIFTGFCYKF